MTKTRLVTLLVTLALTLSMAAVVTTAQEEEAAAWARDIRDAEEHCRARYMCYYRECAPAEGTVVVGPPAGRGAGDGR